MRYLQKKRAKENELINQNSQPIYTYSTVPAQQMNTKPQNNNQQQTNSQPIVYNQQMYQQ